VTFKKSRVRESRTLGSVRAKAEWLSYSTILTYLAAERNAAPLQLAPIAMILEVCSAIWRRRASPPKPGMPVMVD